MVTYRRLLTAPRGSFFLFGVRGAGKSTWTKDAFPDAHFVDLLDESLFQSLVANPALFALEIRDLPREKVVVLDGVQRVPALLDAAQAVLDEAPRRFRFLLSGSSARKLRRGQVKAAARSGRGDPLLEFLEGLPR